MPERKKDAMVRPNVDFRRPAYAGILALGVLAGGTLAWSSLARISGAVIASGSVVVEGKPKSIQHLDGGIVKRIFVSTDDRVSKDQVLVLLDSTAIEANLTIYQRRLRDAIVRRERLVAELHDKPSFDPPVELARLLNVGDLSQSIEQQAAMLQARRQTQESQIAQFDEKIAQFQNQISGIEGMRTQKEAQVAAFTREIDPVAGLVRESIAAETRLLALQRARADLHGQIAEHRAEIARLQNSIAETRLAKLQLQRESREKAFAELDKTESQIDELRQQADTTAKQLGRVAIRAPVAGTVHELNVFTIGGVVQPGQVVMQVVPSSGRHEIEVNLDTQSVDQVQVGQPAVVRFPAFNQRTTPELDGHVSAISPSSVVDQRTGAAFFRVAIRVPQAELARLGGKRLVPGMPVEAHFVTAERTAISYLVKPLTDNLRRAWRER